MLAVTAVADTFANARARAYRAVDQIDFADGFHRRDIGWRELERAPDERRSGAISGRLCAAGLVIGPAASRGSIAFRPRSANHRCSAVAAFVLAGPRCRGACGTGRSAPPTASPRRVERGAQPALDYYEMTKVTAQLHREPLTRQLILSGPADDFQRSELVRRDRTSCPASASASWSHRRRRDCR